MGIEKEKALKHLRAIDHGAAPVGGMECGRSRGTARSLAAAPEAAEGQSPDSRTPARNFLRGDRRGREKHDINFAWPKRCPTMSRLKVRDTDIKVNSERWGQS